jgi:hypothetical protein
MLLDGLIPRFGIIKRVRSQLVGRFIILVLKFDGFFVSGEQSFITLSPSCASTNSNICILPALPLMLCLICYMHFASLPTLPAVLAL